MFEDNGIEPNVPRGRPRIGGGPHDHPIDWRMVDGSCPACDEINFGYTPDAATSLTDFLLARIAEDEASARKLIPIGSSVQWPSWHRLLVECEAKRRIVALIHDETWSDPAWGEALHATFALLALPYADHPDYRQEWKP